MENRKEKFTKVLKVSTKEMGGREYPLIIAGRYAKKLSIYIDREKNKAIIPVGWTVSKRRTENVISKGLVCYNIPENEVKKINWNDDTMFDFLGQNYDQIVYIPINNLKENGVTPSGCKVKFGKRNWKQEKNFENKYKDDIDAFLVSRIEKYSGMYVSRYPMSINENKNSNVIKFVNSEKYVEENKKITESKNAISKFTNSNYDSHLVTGSEFDTILEWIDETNPYALDKFESEFKDIEPVLLNNIFFFDKEIVTDEKTDNEKVVTRKFRRRKGRTEALGYNYGIVLIP